MRAPQTTRPVFFDPKGRRAKVTNAVLAGCAAVAVFVAVVIWYGVYFGVGSPILSVRSEDNPSRALSVDLLPRAESEIPLSLTQGRAIPPDAAKAIRMAFLSTGSTPGAMLSLQRHAEEIDAVIPDWLRLRDTDGEVAMLEGPGRAAVVGWIRANVSRIQIYPEITSSLSAAKTAAFLSDRWMQERLALRISAYAADNDFAGVVLNLRDMRDSHVGRLAAFVDEIGRASCRERVSVLV
jgi:peptidoglycan-N-acetylglucosamine deacetylase